MNLRLAHRVVEVCRPHSFRVETDRGPFESGSLVLATGGLSIPKLGATGFTHDVARRFGLRLTELRPGLVPLTFSNELLALMRSLTGVSLDSEVALDRHRFHQTMLFTHRGLSGPAILQISSYWQRGPITLNLLPGGTRQGFCSNANGRGLKRNCAASWRRCSRSAWPRRWRQRWTLQPRNPGDRMKSFLAPRGWRSSLTRVSARLCCSFVGEDRDAKRFGRLRQGRSDVWRRRYARPVVAHDAGEWCPWPVRHRRSG